MIPMKTYEEKEESTEIVFKVERKLETFNHDIQDLIYQLEHESM